MVNNGGFYVEVYPHVDYAFIVALLIIINDIKFYYDELLNLTTKMTPLVVGMITWRSSQIISLWIVDRIKSTQVWFKFEYRKQCFWFWTTFENVYFNLIKCMKLCLIVFLILKFTKSVTLAFWFNCLNQILILFKLTKLSVGI